MSATRGSKSSNQYGKGNAKYRPVERRLATFVAMLAGALQSEQNEFAGQL